MDYTFVQLMHDMHLGMDDLAANSGTMRLWVFAEMCTARCPQDVDAAKVVDAVEVKPLHQEDKPVVQRSSQALFENNSRYVEAF
ncbi:MAG: hypothetical protein JSW59_09585 [Phycisphaerales bacterium]|nr:MAG: hypothetical protein JSW59_09585 [Phycisphaerales bacterium]